MSHKVFLFPLTHTCLIPGANKPLNIFEPRYVQMIKDSMEEDIPIALVYGIRDGYQPGDISIPHEYFNYIRPIIGHGIPRMIQDLKSEKRMIITLPGEGKGKVLKILETDRPYIVCEYEPIVENQTLRSESILLCRRVRTEMEKYLLENMKFPEQRKILMSRAEDPYQLVGMYTELAIDDP